MLLMLKIQLNHILNLKDRHIERYRYMIDIDICLVTVIFLFVGGNV